jgi:hypothetical protein
MWIYLGEQKMKQVSNAGQLRRKPDHYAGWTVLGINGVVTAKISDPLGNNKSTCRNNHQRPTSLMNLQMQFLDVIHVASNRPILVFLPKPRYHWPFVQPTSIQYTVHDSSQSEEWHRQQVLDMSASRFACFVLPVLEQNTIQPSLYHMQNTQHHHWAADAVFLSEFGDANKARFPAETCIDIASFKHVNVECIQQRS